MAYIGNSPANVGNYQIVDDISSSFNGSLVSFALTSGSIAITPAKSGQLLVGINGVMQEPDDGGTNGFKVSGSNVVFSSAPASGDTFWAVYQGQNVDIGTPSDDVVDTAHIKDNAITTAKIAAGTIIASDVADGSITNVKMADDAVGVAELSATGTASNSVFLRGDNSWQTAGSTSASDLTSGTLPIARIADGAVTAAKVAADVATQAELDTVSTVASAALPKAGGAMTGAITTNSTFDGVDIATRDAILTSTTTTAGAALPKAGGAMTGDTTHTDVTKDMYGAGNDLQIYHDGSNSQIKDYGTGSLLISGNTIAIQKSDNNETLASFNQDSDCRFYYDDVLKLQTTSAGVTVTGTVIESTPMNAITSIVTPGSLGNINMGTSWATVNTTYYKWVLPAAGTYLIGGIFRSRQWVTNGFMKVRLYDNTNSTAISLSDRMMLESGVNANTLNAIGSPIWKHTCTGAVTLYLQGYSSSAGNSGIQEDSNGMNECWHVRLF